jgi:hypothetical protein
MRGLMDGWVETILLLLTAQLVGRGFCQSNPASYKTESYAVGLRLNPGRCAAVLLGLNDILPSYMLAIESRTPLCPTSKLQ